MLARLLQQPLFTERRSQPRRSAVVLPFIRPKAEPEIRRGPSHGWLGRGSTVLRTFAKDGADSFATSQIAIATSVRRLDEPVQDWLSKYPCTRMHGAAFEAEFYPAADEQF